MSRQQDSIARWSEILRRQAGSGLSVAAFCRRSHIPQASFYSWRRKLRGASTFTEVRVSPEPGPATGALELVLPGRHRIVVRPGFDRVTLLALIDTLERSPALGAGEESGA